MVSSLLAVFIDDAWQMVAKGSARGPIGGTAARARSGAVSLLGALLQ